MNHRTPAPWKVRVHQTEKNKNGTYTAFISEEIGLNFVKVTGSGTWAKEEAEETAAFIVTACNAHEELLTALKLTWAIVDGMRKPGINLYVEPATVEAVESALAKAEESR